MASAASTHDVLGTTVTMPVEIRHARCFVAGFTADSDAVERAIRAGGDAGDAHPRPLRIRPGRTMCMLVFVDYVDGDLGPYNEFGVCFLVEDPTRPPSSPIRSLRSLIGGDARALIHHLPVDGDFTLAAGRGIWGFPKTLADFEVDHDSSTKHGRVVADGQLVADLTVRPGIRVPDSSQDTVLNAYSQLDGVLRMTPWRLTSASGTRTRIGGADLVLGTHPIADELRSLKLSRHALMASSVSRVTMAFEDATVISATP
ncbi:acetoacetate decarboxylase family protein [Gordonia hankookensis]|uniref:Acetoacetate decarboxylase family protein n=1 Tax=Gordonia hankookensis TaxID=589403 RepID=A0ABR7W7H7_9ACTN|nr:acetoacetate decarboxylase family protein [Gordonia hankookensis]MBD1318775.1 acetoacetate decarboxylase family protein [Gordonia hankookensis]NDZ94295.1 acetoacetate decarboxylase family protein [Streptomyces sp. SID11726]NEB25055.1 acetoacetate decarboxylase family protein [Streptomyces sp. SID6673]